MALLSFPSSPVPAPDWATAHAAPCLLLSPGLGGFHSQCSSTGREVLADSMKLCLAPGLQTQDQTLTTLPWTEVKPVLVIWPQPSLVFDPVVSWKLPVAAGN